MFTVTFSRSGEGSTVLVVDSVQIIDGILWLDDHMFEMTDRFQVNVKVIK